MGFFGDILKSAIGSALGTAGIDRDIRRQNQILLDQQRELQFRESERRRQAAYESQRKWDEVHKINMERYRKGLPQLPYPPRFYY